MNKRFSEWYANIQEVAQQVPAESLNAGADMSSKEAVSKAPNNKKKHEKDVQAKGPGAVDVPVAGADYASGKDK